MHLEPDLRHNKMGTYSRRMVLAVLAGGGGLPPREMRWRGAFTGPVRLCQQEMRVVNFAVVSVLFILVKNGTTEVKG